MSFLPLSLIPILSLYGDYPLMIVFSVELFSYLVTFVAVKNSTVVVVVVIIVVVVNLTLVLGVEV